MKSLVERSKGPDQISAGPDQPLVLRSAPFLIYMGLAATFIPVFIILSIMLFHINDPRFWADLKGPSPDPSNSFWWIIAVAALFSWLGLGLLWGAQGRIDVTDHGFKYKGSWTPLMYDR